ncbi:transposase [bacterium]|nr:transposase [bacterium]MBU3955078.1 transposase [bacterium]
MPRSYRFVADDAYYHILSRGNNKKRIFEEEKDYEQFLEIMKLYFKSAGIEVIHYALMTNHYHLIVKIKDAAGLKKALQQLNQGYGRYHRKMYGGVGYFWQGRYKSFLIESGRYLLECGIYIELNPVRAGIVAKPEDYQWSSYQLYGEGKENKIITVSPEYEGLSETKEGRIQMYREMLKYRFEEKRKLDRYFKTGVYGSGEFEEKLKGKGLAGLWSHSGRPKKPEARRGVKED